MRRQQLFLLVVLSCNSISISLAALGVGVLCLHLLVDIPLIIRIPQVLHHMAIYDCLGCLGLHGRLHC